MNPFDLMKNMQNIQQQMQEKLTLLRSTGSSGGGMVEVTINGKMEVQNINIEADIIDPEDPKTLELLVAGAFNNAVSNMQEQLKQEALSMTGGMNIPGMMGS
ncbi:MAG: YbaB/EbfC family nucleoid-associated protein [Sphaerochaetaceae bacterium]|nr:YbaB/EbfC family nucleoid-associated protein [Sphaerochaetaceae bacterium]